MSNQKILDVVVKTAPSVEPVVIADMTDAGTDYSRIDFAADDTLITNLIQSAREWVEKFLGRSLITQTRVAYITNYDQRVWLPYGPIDTTSTDVIVKEKYLDQSTTLTKDSDFYVMGYTTAPSDVFLNMSSSLNVTTGKYPPEAFLANHHLEIEYVCGYGSAASDVPMPIREAIMRIASTSYETRNDHSQTAVFKVPQDAENLLYPYIHPEKLI